MLPAPAMFSGPAALTATSLAPAPVPPAPPSRGASMTSWPRATPSGVVMSMVAPALSVTAPFAALSSTWAVLLASMATP